MSEPDGPGRPRGPKGEVFARQLRRFDGKIADLRGFYDGLNAEERSGFRSWLERVDTAADEGRQWSAQVLVRTECDVCDESGETLRWADAVFSTLTMLAAIKAWDSGQDYAPFSVQP
jgi:hypothetical protein